jgi:hypothetical protein
VESKKSVRDPVRFETIAPRWPDASGRPREINLIAESEMAREVTGASGPGPAASLVAVALGAAAVGAVAIGALAIGRLAIGRLTIRKAQFGSLEVDELTVRRLRIIEPQGPNS